MNGREWDGMPEKKCEKTGPQRMRRIHPVVRYIWISTVSGSIPAVLNAIFGHPSGRQFLNQMLEGMLFAGCIGALCTVILPRIAEPILRLPQGWKWLTLVSVIVGLAALGCAAAILILLLTGRVLGTGFWSIYVQAMKTCVLITLTFGLSAFFYEVLVARSHKATADLKARDEAAEKLRQAATEARLSSLESRVQPHFLFNTLNSILALIREDPSAAEGMVERLAALLRFSLDANQSRLVPLALEAKIVRDYLEIEQARFGTRLRFTMDIAEQLNELGVPPMSLQTLVENSVKYAVSTRREGASILVSARVHGPSAVLEVVDDGPGLTAAHLKPGHGLELLQNRMDGLFGSDASLVIETLDAGGTRVALHLPDARYGRTESAEVDNITSAWAVR